MKWTKFLRLALLLAIVWATNVFSQEEKPCGRSELVQFYASPLANIGQLKEEYVIWAAITFRPGVKEVRIFGNIASSRRTGDESQSFKKNEGMRQRYYGEPGGLMGYGWEGFPTVTVVKCEEIKEDGKIAQYEKLSPEEAAGLFGIETLRLAKAIVKAKDWKERGKLFAERFPDTFAKLQDKQTTRVQKLLDTTLATCSEEEMMTFCRAGYVFSMRSLEYEQLAPYFKDKWEGTQKLDKKVVLEQEKKEISKDGRYWVSQLGIVTDTKTGLEWYVEPESKKEREDEREMEKAQDTNWYGAKSWVDYLTVGGGGWRMPTKSELLGLYQKGKGSRNMDPVFKTTGWFIWTDQVDESDNSYVWGVDFYYGRTVLSPRRQSRGRSLPGDSRAFAVRAIDKKR